MLVQGKNVIGTRVFAIDTGKELDKVEDIIYDPSSNRVKALLIDEGGWFSEAKVIPIESVESIGEDAVMVNSQDDIIEAKEISLKVASIARDGEDLTKTKLITEEGNELGKVNDIIFNDDNGKVVEFEVSQGALKNMQSGIKRVKVEDIVTIGEDATIVKTAAEEDIREQAYEKGIQGTVYQGMQHAKAKAKSATTNMKFKSQKVGGKIINRVDRLQKDKKLHRQAEETRSQLKQSQSRISQKLEEGKEKLSQGVSSLKGNIAKRRRQDAIGKYLTKTIFTSDDETLAERGQLITNELLQKASSLGLEEQVLMNTSESPPSNVINGGEH